MKAEHYYVLIVLYNFLCLSPGTICQTLNASTDSTPISSARISLKNVEKYLLPSTTESSQPSSFAAASQTPLLRNVNTLIPLTTLQLISIRNISELPFTIPEATTIVINIQNQSPLTSMTSNLLVLSDSNSSSTQSTLLMAEHESSTESDIVYQSSTANCTEKNDENCIIDHNVTCVGEREYCNYTYDEYISLLYDYIYPTTPEWILICSHLVVFIMGLVSLNL